MRVGDLAGSKVFWLFLVLSVVYLFSLSDPFFWDTITQSSKRPNWFFQNGFRSFLLPKDLDSGHPPAFNWYIAACWMLFGKSLIVSHVAMLPFIVVIMVFSHRLAQHFLQKSWIWTGLIFFILDPTLLAQISLVSNDIVQLAGFLLGFWALLERKPVVLLLAGSILLFVSLRGSLIYGALVLMQIRDWWLNRDKITAYHKAAIYAVFIPIALFGSYLWFHYSETGWALFSPNPNWSDHREVNNLRGFINSGGIMIWRILDFGRIVWLLILGGLWFGIKQNRFIDPHLRMQLIFLTVTTIPVFVTWSNPVSCRYFMPHLFLLSLMMGSMLSWLSAKRRSFIIGISLCFLVSGHFWKYPDHIAQVWDGSLAYKPYFRTHKNTVDFIRISGIDPGEIGTGFPMKGSRGDQILDDYDFVLPKYDLEKDNYILYNTVSNDFDKPQLAELSSSNWVKIFENRSGQIRSVLYKRRP